jgi:hypothetical protein
MGSVVPERIQLRRTQGWRMPPNTIKVDRTTRWGNPMQVRPGYSATRAVQDYVLWLEGRLVGSTAASAKAPPSVEEIRRHLRGKNLACWCAPGQPCHVEILLKIANEGTPIVLGDSA